MCSDDGLYCLEVFEMAGRKEEVGVGGGTSEILTSHIEKYFRNVETTPEPDLIFEWTLLKCGQGGL